jgi:hypothetical protein
MASDDPPGTLRADVVQVKASREETFLLFGRRGATRSQPAALERRIMLPPSLAKQLAGALRRAVDERAWRLANENAMPAGLVSSAAGAQDVPAQARAMFDLVQGLGAGFGLEKSLKLSEAGIAGERVILGVRASRTTPAALLALCRALGMPESAIAQFEPALAQANTVGFGFEGDGHGGSFKVYLEFWDRLSRRLQQQPGNLDPELLFLGFKWPAGDPSRAVVARYTCHPRLSIAGIVRRLGEVYPDDSPSLQAAREIVALAASRIARGNSFVYVEAAEDGNPRRSFDINFYKAGLRTSELLPALQGLAVRYSIGTAALRSALAGAAGRAFGHLSGGRGRDGRDFLTVYYEIEGI